MPNDRETVVVGNGGSGGGWFLAGILAIGILVFGVLLYNGVFTGDSGSDLNIQMDVPEVTTNNG